MLGLVSGSQGALPTNMASSGGLAPPPHKLHPPQPLERGPVLRNRGNMGDKGTMGHRLEQHWESDTKAPNPSFHTARSPLPRGRYLTGTLPNCID